MMTINQARVAGYRALTTSYELPREFESLGRVLTDLRRGRIDHVLVKDGNGVAVWRRGRTRIVV